MIGRGKGRSSKQASGKVRGGAVVAVELRVVHTKSIVSLRLLLLAPDIASTPAEPLYQA